MKKALLVGLTGAMVASWVTFALAKATGPEADAAAATFTAQYTRAPKQATCSGEDAQTYARAVSKLSGSSHETTSGADFRLTGKLNVNARVTVNVATGLGWAEGTFTLLPSTTRRDRVIGSIQAVVQATSETSGVGRGFVTGTYQVFHSRTGRWVSSGDRLWANAEFSQTRSGIDGSFGGSSGSTSDLAAEITGFTCK